MSAAKKAIDDKLQATLDDIDKAFGTGTIGRLDEDRNKVAVIPTGVMTLDRALGSGGIPRGRITTLYGPFGGGKSTLAMHVIAEAQKLNDNVAFIDSEYGMDPAYAAAIGVSIHDTFISQPDHGNMAFEIIDRLVNSGQFGLIVVDSATALVPRAELEGDYGDAVVGLQARMFSQAMRKLIGPLGRTGTSLVFTSQLREKVGVVYGNPEVLPGGRALPFYSSVLIEIRRKGAPDQADGAAFANEVQFKIPKNRVGKPYQTASADIVYGEGFSKTGALLDVAVELEIVQKSGAWFTYEGQQLGQGKAKARDFLASDPMTYDEINKRVRELL